MGEPVLAATVTEGRTAGLSLVERIARKALSAKLQVFTTGSVELVDADGTYSFGSGRGPRASVCVLDPAFYPAVAFGGSVGAAESYMDGHWTCDDLPALFRVMVLNGEVANQRTVDRGLGRITEPLNKAYHWLRRNTASGSRRNIAEHYDLGNDFFKLFLDETMMYSCAVFPRENSSLLEASQHKISRICEKLDLSPEHHLLEIGTGWGGLAIHAAKTHGCRVTTTTISKEQHRLATDRVREAGLADRVTVLQEDYRDLTGRYDRLVSVEMIEAVGHHYYDTYFGKCCDLLKPDGLMLLQAITISDQAFERHKDSVDFIKRFIFPGSCIPSNTRISRSLAEATDLRLVHLEDIGPHYARTLRHWREAFMASRASAASMGLDATFVRMWEFYLAYCEGGFAERYLSDVQMLLAKPLNRRDPILPLHLSGQPAV
jgi:cyclopropane-fatty-acyl-phospholipid synthase